MDVIKTSLIIGIAVTLYYLLLQWPNQQPITQIQKEKPIEESFIVDSNDSLTDTLAPMERPAPTTEPTPKVGRVYQIENEDLLLFVDAKSGRIIRSKLKSFNRSLNDENSLELFGEAGGNLYLANSGFYVTGGGKYLEPNFSSLRSERGADGSLVYTLFGESEGFYYQRKLKLDLNG